MNQVIILFSFVGLQSVLTRDFYFGIFRKNDFLVAQDNVFKQKIPYSYVYAEYGRLFKCPITYFRVVDRLGMGGRPTLEFIKGGLNKKYVVVRIKSQYNFPISVNVYVGCENKHPRISIRPNQIVTVIDTTVTENVKVTATENLEIIEKRDNSIIETTDANLATDINKATDVNLVTTAMENKDMIA